MKNIAIFASGSGSNAENIFNYFKDKASADVVLMLTNNVNAFVLERAKKLGVESVVFSSAQLKTDELVNLLKDKGIDFIVLAGFLLKIPENLIAAFPNRIINIHPALLPKYGGKGMYGDAVHKAVVANKEKESGITIHYVNEHYDEGTIVFQAKCPISETNTYEDVAHKIHQLEYEHFPSVIERILAP
ncbi:MAG: phosphoribosylglycinamide formyltransferase [Vicingaceae bacterium]|nr:phosphoribosylglycinamide formyltransferase [Vicingaceae bacterium]